MRIWKSCAWLAVVVVTVSGSGGGTSLAADKLESSVSAQGGGDWTYASMNDAHKLAKRDCYTNIHKVCDGLKGTMKGDKVDYSEPPFCSTRNDKNGSKQYKCGLSCTGTCRHR